MDLEWINLIYFFFVVYGIATIISEEYVFARFIDKLENYHMLYYLLTCNKCLSIWVGLLVSLLGLRIHHPISDALAAYTFTYIVNSLTNFLDISTSKE